jgi:hypothetical protein
MHIGHRVDPRQRLETREAASLITTPIEAAMAAKHITIGFSTIAPATHSDTAISIRIAAIISLFNINFLAFRLRFY